MGTATLSHLPVENISSPPSNPDCKSQQRPTEALKNDGSNIQGSNQRQQANRRPLSKAHQIVLHTNLELFDFSDTIQLHHSAGRLFQIQSQRACSSVIASLKSSLVLGRAHLPTAQLLTSPCQPLPTIEPASHSTHNYRRSLWPSSSHAGISTACLQTLDLINQ